MLWLKARDRDTFIYYLMHDYAYSAQFGGAYPPALETRLMAFKSKISAALDSETDEVLAVVGVTLEIFWCHFQYLCAFDRPGTYDYFQITAGRQSLADVRTLFSIPIDHQIVTDVFRYFFRDRQRS